MTINKKPSLSGSNGLFNKVRIRDLDRQATTRDLDRARSGLRELDAAEVLFVAGGRMASRTTCSGGCADDCGY